MRLKGARNCPKCQMSGMNFVELTKLENNFYISNIRVIGCLISDCRYRETEMTIEKPYYSFEALM